MTFYDELSATLLSDVFPLFRVGGASWTRTRTTAHTPAADGSASTATVALSVLDNRRSDMAASMTGWPVLDSAWVAYGADDVDLRAGDTITDGTSTYTVTGAPETHQGFLAAPLEKKP